MLYRASVYLSVSRTKGKFEYQIYSLVFSFQKHACVYLQASLTDKDFRIILFFLSKTWQRPSGSLFVSWSDFVHEWKYIKFLHTHKGMFVMFL